MEAALTLEVEEARSELVARVRARGTDLEQAIAGRIGALEGSASFASPALDGGLRRTVAKGLEFGLASAELGERREVPVPVLLLAGARTAARCGVGLELLLRRYFAGYALLTDALVGEAESGDLLPRIEVTRLMREQATVFDRLIAAVSTEHARETQRRRKLSADRRCEQVKRLLAGELLDTSDLDYPLAGWHLAVVALGLDGAVAVRALAAAGDFQLLVVRCDQKETWAWLGSRSRVDPDVLFGQPRPRSAASFGVGEPGQGVEGWRASHQQAAAAARIARRGSGEARYKDVALVAATARDGLLEASLRSLFLEPINAAGEKPKAMRETLRAYLSAGHQTSSTAAALGISRTTVTNRLRAIEARIGSPIASCAAELELAMRMNCLYEEGDDGPP